MKSIQIRTKTVYCSCHDPRPDKYCTHRVDFTVFRLTYRTCYYCRRPIRFWRKKQILIAAVVVGALILWRVVF